jgi:hypothetical protein
MPLLPIAPAPGVCFSTTQYAVGKDSAFIASGSSTYRQGAGRWANAQNIEFIAGFPQKIAGWSAAVQIAMNGVPRCNANWRGRDGLAREAIGTTTHLYVWQAGTATDITPLQVISTGTLTNPFTTTNQSTTVAVADSSQKVQNGDWVMLSTTTAIGGILVNGWFQVSGRTGSGYNITAPLAATSSAGPGGGSVSFEYPRITLTNPFTTVLNSTTVKVTQTAHNQVAGSFVIFDNATIVGGILVNGEYPIASVIDADNYNITIASPATSGATGGGTPNVIYLVAVHQVTNSALPVWGQNGVVWGAVGSVWGTNNVTVATLPDGWTLAAYGSQMLACPVGGTIYIYDPAAGGRAYPLLNAPINIQAMFVTPERFVVALGTASSTLQMAWSDQNDYTQWTTTATNTANTGRNLIGGSYFVGGVAVTTGVSLIWTDRCIFQMSYSGGQEIYNTPLLGDSCGLISPWAVTVEGGVAFWMSDQDWWTWNGGAPAPLSSDDVRASVFQATGEQAGLNRQQLGKACAVLNRAKRQVRFFFPSASASENDGGMIYQYDQQCFSPISFGRSCGTDANLLQTPMSCDQFGLLYYDETGTDANGAPLPWLIEIADMDISNGDRNVDVFGLIPNFEVLSGDCQFIAQAAYYPDDIFQNDGPWPLTGSTQRQDLRLDGKLFAFQMTGNGLGATMRMGINRLDVQPSGARR